MDPTSHYLHSTLRERIVEHVFVGDALRTLWRRGIVDVEVLRSEFDAHGYDLVMARGKIVRHIQFKTGKSLKPGKVSISQSLADKPSGCVIWIRVADNLDMGPFFWFGGSPGEPLPAIDGYSNPRRPTHNKDGERPFRKNHREIPCQEFRELSELADVLEALFGPLSNEMSKIEWMTSLKNGGTLEEAAAMANHASTHTTTQLYDRRCDDMTLDEIEIIGV